jgi:hypothetical protein
MDAVFHETLQHERVLGTLRTSVVLRALSAEENIIGIKQPLRRVLPTLLRRPSSNDSDDTERSGQCK